jgi:hypothetical protein
MSALGHKRKSGVAARMSALRAGADGIGAKAGSGVFACSNAAISRFFWHSSRIDRRTSLHTCPGLTVAEPAQ